MNVFVLVADLLKYSLKIWDRHLENKYFEEYRKLIDAIQEEEAKDVLQRNQLRIDNANKQLLILARKLTTDLKRQDTSD